MRLINSSFKVLLQSPGLEGMYKQIEIGARNCYKSEDKITDDSAEKMVEFLKNRGHYSPLEHGTVYLHLSVDTINYYIASKYRENKYSKVVLVNSQEQTSDNGYYITTNYRVLVENGWLRDLTYLCKPTKHHEKRVSVMITCPIGISREFNRHRVFSISEQSTRYCNYSKDKFGVEITFVIPEWATNLTPEYKSLDYSGLDHNELVFLDSLAHAERSYMTMIRDGARPQEARDILPLATATTVMYTGFVSDWKHFFELRTSAGAHPDARAIATPLAGKFNELNLL